MRKKIELAVLLLFLAVLVLLSKNLQKLVSSGNVTAKNKIIVLDSGHGGDDPGKIGVNQAKEKDVNLEIARKIKKAGEKRLGSCNDKRKRMRCSAIHRPEIIRSMI